MSDSINIGTANIGNAIVGGTGGTISGSGVVNVYGDQLGRLRALLDDLVKVIDGNTVQSKVREAAELARAEADKPCPEPRRLRALIKTVINGATGVAAVIQVASNVMGIITLIENAVR